METHGNGPAARIDSSRPGRVPFGTPTRGRTNVEIPAWVLLEVLAPAKPSAFRLGVMLYLIGKPVTTSAGERRLYWNGSQQELARRIGVTKPHIIEAEQYLAAAGFLQIHRPNKPGAPHGLSVPTGEAGHNSLPGHNLLPASEPVFPTHGDDDLQIPVEPGGRFNTTSSKAARGEAVTICNRLADYGVTAPEAWLRRAGPERCTAALDYLDGVGIDGLTNPAGFLHGIVHGRAAVPKAPPKKPARGSLEEPIALYGGSLGKPIRRPSSFSFPTPRSCAGG